GGKAPQDRRANGAGCTARGVTRSWRAPGAAGPLTARAESGLEPRSCCVFQEYLERTTITNLPLENGPANMR
ncbi:hypothetical protein P4H65_20885, partial [Paenibacillus chitinolyticus]|uniref:hypothetical protein n=1 Tax=Paenibacillus chitinolyticus TaxID=79263 RepID=UPI002DBB34A4